MAHEVAAVVIGRNEGERLARCIESLRAKVAFIVYVDSGSTDGSAAMARAKGVDVVALDVQQPFTAARARNAGFRRALHLQPSLAQVQFVDGDCEVQPGWLERARAFLDANPQAAAVCGRRRERHPERSIYNRLCDIEWNVPAGPAKAFGGDVMLRAEALEQVGGYRESLIAGEEPELCVRLRAKGWQINVLDAEMTLHDAAMTRLRQWWTRTVRAGYAYAEGAYLHGASPERHAVRPLCSALAWGLVLPLTALCSMFAVGNWALILLLAYPLQVLRLFGKGSGSAKLRLLKAGFLVLGKFPQTLGAVRYWSLKFARQEGGLIEYK
ncbi:MAG: glycosyltransferase [Burkholderiaceae bacterium]